MAGKPSQCSELFKSSGVDKTEEAGEANVIWNACATRQVFHMKTTPRLLSGA